MEVVQTADRTTETAQPQARALGRYRLVRRLGHGAFGVVWLAHDEHLDRMVAVKRIEVLDEHVAARAEREAVAAARLSHPAVVTLHEAGRDEHAVHLVSELVRGPTLADLIEAGALSDRDVVRIGVALSEALEHAHARGIVHRDVKPANIIVPERPAGESAIAKLTDFGVAAVTGDSGLTRTGDVVGTLAYMAPEQAEGGAVTGAADLYSLALVLYEALTGVNPVRAPGAAATVRRLGTRLPSLGRLRPDLPAPLVAAIDCALLPDAAVRGTLRDFRVALESSRERAGRAVGGVASPRDDTRRVARSAVPRLCAGAGGAALCAATMMLAPVAPSPSTGVVALASAVAGLLIGVLPRAGWTAAAAGLLALLAAAGLGGLALLGLAAAAPTVVLLARDERLWSVPAGAPLIAIAGAALAWPSLAGQVATVRVRAALGALGLWWCLLAEQASGRTLLLGALPGAPQESGWQGSADDAVREVLWPLIQSGAPLIALPWALAAAVLPLLVRGRWLGADIVAVSAWAAGLAAATAAVAATIAWPAAPADVRGTVSGALVAGVIALLAAALRAPRGDADLP